MKLMAALLTSILVTGCASIQKGDPVRSAEIKKFQSKEGMAQIYVCRSGSILGMAIMSKIEIDKVPLATIASSTYAYSELKSGDHVIVAKSPEHESVLNFKIGAGEKKFFKTWIVPGVFAGRAVIDELPIGDGKECIKDAELVEAVAD